MAGSTSAMLIYVGTDNSFQHSNQVQTSDVLAVFGIAYLTNTLVRIVTRPFNRKRICRKLGISKALAMKWEKEQSHGYTYTPIAEYSDGGG